ncbi:MAG TPA: hypothetical protein VFT86_00060 [Gaiellaceae bacterium]|nr:hypothetical protein [Gaiellaceae bacterium]
MPAGPRMACITPSRGSSGPVVSSARTKTEPARHTWLATGTSGQAPFSVSLPAISRHLKVLERASLTTRPTGGLDSRSASGSPTVWRPSEQGWLESFTKLDATLAA